MRPVYKTKTITERVYTRLSKAIIDKSLLPGQHLTIGGLACELGVSRTPVRQALIQLKQCGLVEGDVMSGGGTFVAGLSHDDLREIFDVREAVELFAVEFAASKARSTALRSIRSKLEQHLAPTDTIEAAKAADADLAFHRAIVNLTGNQRLQDIWRQVGIQLSRFWYEGRGSSQRASEDARECLRIAVELEKRNAVQARATMKQHLDKTRRAMSDYLSQ